MINLDRAIKFVVKNGNLIEQARLKFIIDDQPPSGEARDQFFSSQRGDGGWSPFWAQDYSSLDATCFRLAQAKQLGIQENEAAFEDALYFLAGRQKQNGSWEEDQSIIDIAPPWAIPGNVKATLYLTASCSFWLSEADEYVEKAEGGAIFLSVYLDRKGQLPSFLQTHWLSGGVWYRLGMKRQFEGVRGYLERRLADLSANNITWLITTLLGAGLPDDQSLFAEASTRLIGFQQSDGRWQSDDGESFDVHTTLEALYALKSCGRIK